MTDSIIEMQTTLNDKRTNFINWIEFNVNDKKVLNAAISYFEYEEQVRKATLQLAEMDLQAANSIKIDNKNLELVISTYKMDRVFNEIKSEIWLSEALKLILIDNYSFDGIKFFKNDIKTLKNDIIK